MPEWVIVVYYFVMFCFIGWCLIDIAILRYKGQKAIKGINDLVEKETEQLAQINKELEELYNPYDHFTEMQESIVSEVNEAINNLKAGRYEEVYNILVELSDEQKR